MTNKTAKPALAVRKLVELEQGYGNWLAFGPDGQRWVTATARGLHLWRDQTVEQKVTAEAPIHGLAFRPNGHELALCPARYDLAQGKLVAVAPIDAQLVAGLDDAPALDQFGIAACAESEDGEALVVTARYSPGRDYDVPDTYRGPHERVLLLHGPARAFRAALYQGDEEIRALAVGTRHVAGGGRTIRVWDRATGKAIAELAHHPVVVRAIAFSPDESALYAVGADGLMTMWNTDNWTLRATWQAHAGDVRALAIHPREPLLATGGNDGTLRLWSTDTPGQMIAEQTLAGPVEGVAFSVANDRLGASVRAFPARIVLFELSRAVAAP
jgi:WD40 repeat protein